MARHALVVGAGVVGLAVAAELGQRGLSVEVWERHDAPGLEQSTHNSGVIHAGFNAPTGTLRARLNVEGNPLLYAFAAQSGVAVQRVGTLVVAKDRPGVSRLDGLLAQGRANGVPGLTRLTPEEAHEKEPHLGPCVGALWAPTGGILDSVALMRALTQRCEKLGVEIRYGSEVDSAERGQGTWSVEAKNGSEGRASVVVNSAGIGSARVARILGAPSYRIYPCLGEYAQVRGPKRDWLRSMVYGLPPPGYPGIGVHITRTVEGGALVGPTARYIATESPPTEALTSLEQFARDAAQYIPGLLAEDFEPCSPGVRAKRVPPGSETAFEDFVIREDPQGSGAIQLVGIESPGLTSALAVARYVANDLVGPALSRSG